MKNKSKNKRCIIAGLFSAKDKEYPLKIKQAKSEIISHGGVVTGEMIQRRGVSRSKKPGGSKRMNEPLDAKYIFSKGKLQELIDLAKSSQADTIVFYNSLNGAQKEALHNATECDIISYLEDIDVS